MAKIRLSNDRRDILRRLAAEAVAATPIEPATEKRVADARKDYDTLFAELAKQTVVELKKAVPAGDLRVCRKYDLTHKATVIHVMDLDSRDAFNVDLFNETAFDRKHLRGKQPWALSYEERQAFSRDKDKAMEKVQVELIERGPGTHHRFLTATPSMVKLRGKLNAAEQELEIAEGIDGDRRRNISRDFEALIAGARTFEDVCEAWPEAKTVTDKIVGDSQQISLVSSDAIDRIRKNMAARGVETS